MKNNIILIYSFKYQYLSIVIFTNLFSFFFFKGFAQTYQSSNYDGFYVNISAGVANFKNKDYIFSSQDFSGSLPFFRTLFEYFDQKNHHLLHIGYATGKLHTSQAPKAFMKENYLHADYFYSRKIGKSKIGRWRNEAGAGVNFFYNSRSYEDFINVNKAAEFVSSLSAIFQTNYLLPGSGEWSLSNRISFPIVSLLTLPDVNILSGQGRVNADSKNSEASFIFIPDYFRINNQFQVEKKVANRHKFILAYIWDVYSIRSFVDKSQAYHLLSFVYQVKFN